MEPDFLRIEGIAKRFGNVTAVHDITLGFGKGEFVSLLGPSGCGKTTILRMIAGFERPTSGRILVEGNDITGQPPNQRKIGMVFQSYALFPNMNVAGNIGFGLKVQGTPARDATARVDEMLELIGLAGYGKRFPFELSGGQQQRVALARALAPRPRMLLLDEPLSALDAKIRVSLREQIRQIQRDLGITTVFVTHDQEEALSISDRIVVMNAGRIEQVGTPFEIYNRPATRFVASFVGQLNTLRATVADAAAKTIILGGRTVSLGQLPADAATAGTIAIAMRPEAAVLNAGDRDVVLAGSVADVNFLGSVIRLRVTVGDDTIDVDIFNDPQTPPPAPGTAVSIGINANDVLVLEGKPG